MHSITPGILNPYEETLEALCNALESFDDDNLFPCYGFGDGMFVGEGVGGGCMERDGG